MSQADHAGEYVGSVDVSASVPVTDAGNATLPNRGAVLAKFEVTAVSGLTVTAEALEKEGGTWRQVASVQLTSGTYTARSAGTTITLSSADKVLIVGNYHATRLKRAGGTSATFTMRSGNDVPEEVTTAASGLATAANQSTEITSLQLLDDIVGNEYETVAASQTAQALGATGATGDLINGILVIPATTSPGNVLLLDNATSITVFAGGASSVSNLVPFFIPLGIKSVSGAWKITTGSNVSCIGVGNFT